MTRRTIVQVIAGAVVAVFALALWLSGVPVELSWLRYYSLAVLVALILWTSWDRWLWRLPVLRSLPGTPPVIAGTWKGSLTSLWEDPAGKPAGSKPAYLVVHQTASSTSASMFTDEARSESTVADVEKSASGATLVYTYLAQPDVTVEDRSRMHHGATMLHVSRSPAQRLEGRYWTDRDTRGRLEFTEHVRNRAADFHEATQLFNSRSGR